MNGVASSMARVARRLAWSGLVAVTVITSWVMRCAFVDCSCSVASIGRGPRLGYRKRGEMLPSLRSGVGRHRLREQPLPSRL